MGWDVERDYTECHPPYRAQSAGDSSRGEGGEGHVGGGRGGTWWVREGWGMLGEGGAGHVGGGRGGRR